VIHNTWTVEKTSPPRGGAADPYEEETTPANPSRGGDIARLMHLPALSDAERGGFPMLPLVFDCLWSVSVGVKQET
jgi:hypothetical protein